MRRKILFVLCFCLLFACALETQAHAEKRRTLGVGMVLGGGFQGGAKTGTFTTDGPIVAAEGLQGIVMLPSLSVRKFFQMRTRGIFVDLSLDIQWHVSNMVWKIVQGAQEGILHIPLSLGLQLGIWLFRGRWRLAIAPGTVLNTNVFVGGGDGGVALEVQLGTRFSGEYLIPAKFFGIELQLWTYGSFGVYGGNSSRHNNVSQLVSGGGGVIFAIAFHFYGNQQM